MKDHLEKGRNLILTRVKHLRIADTYGWFTVKEFKANELSSGEAEEKRLKRAIKNAESVKTKLFKKARFDDDKEKPKSKQDSKYRMDDIVCHGCRRVGHYLSHCPFTSASTTTSQIPSIAYSTTRSSSTNKNPSSTNTRSKSG
eukprot:TCONS_00060990-protein